MQRLEKIGGQKSGSKTARMVKLLQFSQGHTKPAFSDKVQGGTEGIGFPKSRIQEMGRFQDFSFPNPDFKISFAFL